MNTNIAPLADYRPFEAWLKSLPSDTIVGYAGRPDECPLQHYLLTVLHLPNPKVYHSAYCLERDGVLEFYLQERWAQFFVEKVDVYNPNPVTAELALGILQEALYQEYAEQEHAKSMTPSYQDGENWVVTWQDLPEPEAVPA